MRATDPSLSVAELATMQRLLDGGVEPTSVPRNGSDGPLLLTQAMAGTLLSVSGDTVRRLTKNGILHPVEIVPRTWRYSYGEIARLAQDGIRALRDRAKESAARTGGAHSFCNGDRRGGDALFAPTGSRAITDPVNRSPKPSKAEVAALGANIRLAREKLGLSQGQFARKVGVSQQKISEWERGLRLRQVITAWRLADVLSQIK